MLEGSRFLILAIIEINHQNAGKGMLRIVKVNFQHHQTCCLWDYFYLPKVLGTVVTTKYITSKKQFQEKTSRKSIIFP